MPYLITAFENEKGEVEYITLGNYGDYFSRDEEALIAYGAAWANKHPGDIVMLVDGSNL